MFGKLRSARTMAYPMRWVKLTFPPRPRARWLLITMRLSAISFAGTARTLVAVGTDSDWSMFCTIRAATPRRTLTFAALASLAFAAGAFAAAGFSAAGFSAAGFAATGFSAGLAGVAGLAGAGAGAALA